MQRTGERPHLGGQVMWSLKQRLKDLSVTCTKVDVLNAGRHRSSFQIRPGLVALKQQRL